MKIFGAVSTAALSLALAAVPLIYAQDQKPDDTKPEARPEHQAKPMPPDKQDQSARPEHNEHPTQQMEKQQQQNEKQPKAAQDDRQKLDDQKRMQDEQKKAQENQEKQNKDAQKQQKEQEKNARQNRPNDNRPNDTKDNRPSDNRAQPAQTGNARGGGRIPDDKFRASFGREHHFHVSHPVVVSGGRPQFAYSGYNFVLVDVWPAEWSYDDDCYVDYVDGEYYLYDLRHPGVQIAIMVVM